MTKKRRQERIAISRFTLPLTVLYGVIVALFAGPFQHGLWVQTVALFVATEMMVILSNRHSLIRVYSRMVPVVYLFLSAMLCFRSTTVANTVVGLCFIAFYMFFFEAYQDRKAAGFVFYAFVMIGIASVFFVQILYLVPVLWVIMIAYILAFSLRTLVASILGLLFPYWFVIGYDAYTNQLPDLLSHFLKLTDIGNVCHYQYNEHQAVGFVFIGLIGLTGIIHFLRNSYQDKIKTRMLYGCFVTMQVATMIFIILQPQHYPFLIHILIISTAALLGHFLALTHTWLTNVAFHVLIALVLLLTAYNLWIPSLIF